MTRLIGINHVALEVGEIEEALAWYGRLFEFSLRGRHGDRMAFIDMGDQFIALSAGRTQAADGARHFGLVVDDREALREALLREGVSVGRSGSVDFHDPWGNHSRSSTTGTSSSRRRRTWRVQWAWMGLGRRMQPWPSCVTRGWCEP